MSANDTQVGGSHYKTKMEHWDFVVSNDLNYFEGQITKYVTRCRKKNGMQDLEKAVHFLQKYMEVFTAVRGHPAVVKHGYFGEKGPPPSDYTPARVEVDATRYVSDSYFQNEGGYGSGMNLYTCRTCRGQVSAHTLAGAAGLHAQPCTLPRPARAG